MGLFRSSITIIIIFFVLVTFLGPVIYYPFWYASYGVEWVFRTLADISNSFVLDIIFNFLGGIFSLISSIFKAVYYNWGLFAWCGWI